MADWTRSPLDACKASGISAQTCTKVVETKATSAVAYCVAADRSPTLCDKLGASLSTAGTERSEGQGSEQLCAEVFSQAECAAVFEAESDAAAFCLGSGAAAETCRDVSTGVSLPLIVAWLVLGAVFFTFRFQFISIRGFAHAIAITRGAYHDPDEEGEVSHFQALSSALSATVGLGNIAGVAVAVGAGGPGAVFWMVVAGFFGMSSKFAECTLGQMYRRVDAKGTISGGPMRYLENGLADLGLPRLGRALAILFSVMCVGASFGGGNMFQANQSWAQLAKVTGWEDSSMAPLIFGLVLATLVGTVIIGGIKRIGQVAGIVVPAMCGLYLLAGFFILITHSSEVPAAFGKIIGEAFTPQAGFGGMLGVLVQGFRRAAFSNEAGVGSASIAHSAAATSEPVREGIVALLEPFIDTIIVCTTTGLVIVITGAYLEPSDGVVMTSNAFGSVIDWFPYVLTFAVLMFAFSTMISWSYYGERCWAYLFGMSGSLVYKGLFLVCVVLGSILELGSVVDFSDLMVLGMSFPNILGAVLLSGMLKKKLDSYWRRYRSGEMKPHSPESSS
ncbi:MAG: alanine/glycine:cation symporter family protein [Myxococcota bacterium]